MDILQSSVKLLKNLDVTELDGEKVMIDFESGKYFMIKGSGNDVWDMLKDGIVVQEIVDGLMQMYEVDEATCVKSVTAFLNQMKDYGFISLS